MELSAVMFHYDIECDNDSLRHPFRIICGLTAFSTKQHIIRAALEAVCFQTRDIIEAMNKDCGIPITRLHVDGKMTTNNLLMQLQADISGVPVLRARSQDITTLGAAMAAGYADGIKVWDLDAGDVEVVHSDTFLPTTREDGWYKLLFFYFSN